MDSPDTCGLDKAEESSLKAATSRIGAGRNLTLTETTRSALSEGSCRVVNK